MEDFLNGLAETLRAVTASQDPAAKEAAIRERLDRLRRLWSEPTADDEVVGAVLTAVEGLLVHPQNSLSPAVYAAIEDVFAGASATLSELEEIGRYRRMNLEALGLREPSGEFEAENIERFAKPLRAGSAEAG